MPLCATEHLHLMFFSHLLQNLMLDCLHFCPTSGFLFDDKWMQL